MYFEAELALAPRATAATRRVPHKSMAGELLHLLSNGWVGEDWVQEAVSPVEVLRRIRWALRTIGIDDVVAVRLDGQLSYLDRQGRPGDLDAVIGELVSSESHPPANFCRAELLIEHLEQPLKYLVKVAVDRIHPPGRLPIRCMAYGLIAEPEPFKDQAGHDALVASSQHAIRSFVDELATALGRDLEADRSKTWIRRCLVRAWRRYTNPGELPVRTEVDAAPIFAGFPGFPAATFYAYGWAEVCHHNHIQLKRTLVVDEGGRPVFHAGSDALLADAIPALLPGADLDYSLPATAVYFAGNDYDAQLRALGRLADAPVGSEAVREALRRREGGGAGASWGALVKG